MKVQDFKENGRLLLGVSGAVYSALLPDYLTYITNNICKNIRVILTDASKQFINENMIEYITGHSPFKNFDFNIDFPAPHISLTKWADLFLVLPSSGNLISKASNGIADDLLSTSILSAVCPVIFCPSMNIKMWEKNVMQRNVNSLESDGHYFQYKIDNVYTISSKETETQIVPDLDNLKQSIYHILNNPKNISDFFSVNK